MTTESKNCNLCGLSLYLNKDRDAKYMIKPQPSGLIDAVVTGGYDSTPGNGYGALDDLVSYKFSL